MIQLTFKYVLRSFFIAFGAAAVISIFNLPGKQFLGIPLSTGRLSFGLLFGIFVFAVMLLIFPLLIWRIRAKHPKGRISMTMMNEQQRQFLKEANASSTWFIGILVAIAIVFVLIDSFWSAK